jgi:hypothetical protein
VIRRFLALLLLAVLGTAAYWLLTTSRAFTEKARYALRRKDGPFELRDYPPLAVATVEMNGTDDDSFMRLFRFIDRGNARGEKIAMTTPVLLAGGSAGSQMSFVLPEKTRASGAPQPSDGAVVLGKRPAERVAVYRFSGGTSLERERAAVEKLRAWLHEQGLTAAGEPVIGYYDAPFIPGILRRNEAILRLAD